MKRKKVERKKGKSKVVKAGSIKKSPYRPHRVRAYAKVDQNFEKENKDVFNKADNSLRDMMNNHGIPRHRVRAH